VHRDISPQNVLVGVDGIARVLDFGVAKAIGRAQHSRSGQLKGKLSYMAPEQLLGRTGRAADIYAASVVLWEALTGQRLFDGEDQATVLSKLMAREISPPSTVNAQLSKGIDALVMRGLSREPSERFATAYEMARAVEEVIGVVTPSEVGHWVEAVAKDALHKRLRRVEALESVEIESVSEVCLSTEEGPPSEPLNGDVPDPAAPSFIPPPAAEEHRLASLDAKGGRASKHRWRVAAVLVLPAVGLLLGGSQSRFARPAKAQRVVEHVSSPQVPSKNVEDDATPAMVFGGLDAVDEPAMAVPEPDKRVATRAPRPARLPSPTVQDRRRPPSPAAATPDCSIPYTIDAAGIRHPRTECL
jgi:serine/threonine-protein kinase